MNINKKLTLEQKQKIVEDVQEEGFWNAIRDGFLDPCDLIDDSPALGRIVQEHYKQIRGAVKILRELESMVNGLEDELAGRAAWASLTDCDD